jgi:hypothetical protein
MPLKRFNSNYLLQGAKDNFLWASKNNAAPKGSKGDSYQTGKQ